MSAQSPSTTNSTPNNPLHLLTNQANTIPPASFLTPAHLAAHLDSHLSAPLPTTLTLSIGTSASASLSLLLNRNPPPLNYYDLRTSALRTEFHAWASLLVRMTKLPSFDVRRITFDMGPQEETDKVYDFFALLTRVSAAVAKAERRFGREGGEGEGRCVFVVRGWMERLGGREEDLGRYCVGVGVVAVETVRMAGGEDVVER